MQMCTCRGESVGLLFLAHTTGLLTETRLVVRGWKFARYDPTWTRSWKFWSAIATTTGKRFGGQLYDF